MSISHILRLKRGNLPRRYVAPQSRVGNHLSRALPFHWYRRTSSLSSETPPLLTPRPLLTKKMGRHDFLSPLKIVSFGRTITQNKRKKPVLFCLTLSKSRKTDNHVLSMPTYYLCPRPPFLVFLYHFMNNLQKKKYTTAKNNFITNF